jgi:hypothetical protein
MAKFSLARQPYYIAVAIFCGFAFLISMFNNSVETGVLSDVYLGLMALTGGLAALSLFYLVYSSVGDDEVDVEVAGLPIGKGYYYLAVLGVCAWRVVK